MTSSPALNQPPPRVGSLLSRVSRAIRVRSETLLGPIGLRPRHLIALSVLRESGGTTQQALATTLEMDGTNVVGLLNELEGRGLIERRRAAQDRRRHVVELTEIGRLTLEKAESELAAVEDEVLTNLGKDQREQLYVLLQQAVGCAPNYAETLNEC
ncbi:MarR family winged helix-turn-helix transcriptional regulator [Amycolatopsis pithecellobii]|uniref:MarR family transcriptional regulator n=1 Tax=Amycolatopsis pithecellobii TaxID=664692 RepID=A0A6N7YIF9_9PSEU|nr:MarR family winged helix-turn-helix transcriptional regulator [Amycolatopsis pithecellobii]MTD52695.1 MarR family transcriptional regulator [Amycolatopsis pithecellobii]